MWHRHYRNTSLVAKLMLISLKTSCSRSPIKVWMPSVLWHYWLGIRKSIWPVKKLSGGVLVWLSVWSNCLHMVQLMLLPSQTTSSLASFKSRLVLPFCYRLAAQEKRPLNGCRNSSNPIKVYTTVTYTQNRLTALCMRLTGWAGTRRNSHPLTPILVIRHPLSTSSIYYDP